MKAASSLQIGIILLCSVLGVVDLARSSRVKAARDESSSRQRQVLVFGGNGFIGASTVEGLVRHGDKVIIVNRGNWYWDSKERIRPHVTVISCDRKNNVTSCSELVQAVEDLGSGRFDAVIDFSSYGPQEMKDALAVLRGKASVYIQISTDSVYDVCDINHMDVPIKEEEAVRPEDQHRREILISHHDYGHRKLEAEDELVKQRSDPDLGIPYVILRLPDVFGPRDTTYRFWMYQLWIKLASVLPKQPVIIPKFLINYKISFIYVEDVARVILNILKTSNRQAVLDQVFNLAYPESVTLEHFLRDIEKALGLEPQNFKIEERSNIYFYPTGRAGPIDSGKAEAALAWKPTPWEEAIAETVRFYEDALKSGDWRTQTDEIIQIQSMQFYSEDKLSFFDAMEKTYNINVSHFKPRDEL